MSALDSAINGLSLLGPTIKSPSVVLVAATYGGGVGGNNSCTVMMRLDSEAPAYLRQLADEAEALLYKAEQLKALDAEVSA